MIDRVRYRACALRAPRSASLIRGRECLVDMMERMGDEGYADPGTDLTLHSKIVKGNRLGEVVGYPRVDCS